MHSPLRLVTLLVVSLLAAMTAHAASPGCGTMEFSKEVLARFPNASRACLDVVNRNDETYGVFKAKIMRVAELGNTLEVRFKLPDGTYSDTRKIQTHADRRVMVQGKPARVNELVVGDELTVYVKMTAPELALAPAEESELAEFTPILPVDAPQQQVAAAMPTTASPTFLAGLIGGLLWLLATVLCVRRFDRR